MGNQLNGRCLCGEVSYRVEERFHAFYLCHCAQCQKVTGSGFAANILTSPDNINWLSGSDKITNYEDSLRSFSKAFCQICGSGVPHINKSGTNLVVPAGSLVDQPLKSPTANLFHPESPRWLKHGLLAKSFDGYPE